MLESIPFIVALQLVLDDLEPILHTAFGDFALVVGGVIQQAALAGVLLDELLQFAEGGFLLGL